MKKIIKYMLVLLLIILSVIIVRIAFLLPDFISSIEISAVIPPRPDNIPRNALWVGGPDGGVYVLVQKKNSDSPTIYEAEIYYSEGSTSYRGKLAINSSDNPVFNYNDVNSYSFWDGDILALQDGRYLTIVGE